MTIDELIQRLEDYRDEIGGDAEVRLMTQQNWPFENTIFGLASVGLDKDTKIGGSGLIMAILGGAVLTSIQGLVSDTSGSIHFAFFVPLFCFGAVAYYGFFKARDEAPAF